jgi:hypothetical protein
MKRLTNNKGQISFKVRQNGQNKVSLNEKLNKVREKISSLGLELKEVTSIKGNSIKKTDVEPISIKWDTKPYHINQSSLVTNYHSNNNKQMNRESEGSTLKSKVKLSTIASNLGSRLSIKSEQSTKAGTVRKQ